MTANLKLFWPFMATTAATTALIITMAACASAPAATTVQPATPAVQPSSAVATPIPSLSSTAQPSASAPIRSTGSTGAAARPGVITNGTLSKINGNTLTLDSQQSQSTVVNISSTTIIQKTVTGTLADLQTGQSITVTGTADASGNIAATAIAIRPQDQNARNTPPAGGGTNQTGTGSAGTRTGSTATGGARTGGGSTFGGTPGTITKIDGNTLTMTSGQTGQAITVTVSSNTTYQKTVTGAASDLQVGQSLMAIGTSDAATGVIAANTITIRATDTSTTGK